MPVVKITDIAYVRVRVRVRVPDLDRAEQFFSDFGLQRSARTPTALYLRGTGVDHHVHVVELGEPRFLSLAFKAATAADLQTLSQLPGASAVEAIDEPGGGQRVVLTDPDGHRDERAPRQRQSTIRTGSGRAGGL